MTIVVNMTSKDFNGLIRIFTELEIINTKNLKLIYSIQTKTKKEMRVKNKKISACRKKLKDIIETRQLIVDLTNKENDMYILKLTKTHSFNIGCHVSDYIRLYGKGDESVIDIYRQIAPIEMFNFDMQ